MRTPLYLTIALVLLAGMAVAQQPGQAPPAGAAGPAMTLTTTAWPDGADIPLKYTQAVTTFVSPEFKWANAPADAVSFVFLMHDPDVALNRGTDDNLHWLLWNIPGKATGLPENVPQGPQLPDGTRQISIGGPMYRGPGAGAAGPRHHYTFEVFALDTMLDVQPAATPAETRANVFKALAGHVRGKAVWVGLFRRPA